MRDGEHRPRHAIITEVQSNPPKQLKWWTWLAYIALAGRRYLCLVTLLVVALNDETSKACSTRFESGHPEHGLTPALIARDTTPHPSTPGAEAVASQLTMLCVLTKKFDLIDDTMRDYVLGQLARADPRLRTDYTRIILELAEPTARKALEEALQTKFRVPIIDDAVDRGIEKGMAQLLLVVLEERFTVPEARRAEVTECTDAGRLRKWTRRAVTAKTLDEVFRD